jgi:alkylation response protein AidB-like acyl-CoA dehydrogenase
VRDAEVLCGGGNLADFFVVAVEGASGQDGMGSLFLLESHEPGLLVEPSTAWNPNAYQATLVTMRNVVLTENHLLGELGGGSSYLSRAENRDRVLVAAIFLGAAQGALDRLVCHANRHRQSENPSRASQAVRRVIADLHVKVDLARLLTHRAGWMEAAGVTSRAASSMAEICATDACQAASMAGTRLLGADMYVPEYTVLQYQPERFATAIGIGPHLQERDIIAKEILL